MIPIVNRPALRCRPTMTTDGQRRIAADERDSAEVGKDAGSDDDDKCEFYRNGSMHVCKCIVKGYPNKAVVTPLHMRSTQFICPAQWHDVICFPNAGFLQFGPLCLTGWIWHKV